jgi:hypothetical protein
MAGGVGKEDPLLWTHLQDVPLDVENFSGVQVARCLELLNVPANVAGYFRREQIDGRFLAEAITKDMLTNDLGCTDLQASRIVMFAKGWRPK